MKKVLIITISIVVVGLIAFTLSANKQEMAENAKLAEVSSDYIPVEVTSITQTTLDKQIMADGTFQAVTDLTVLSETQGQVVKVYKEKGVKAKKGELLAQVENEALQAQVAAAEANFKKLQADLDRFTNLSRSNAVTERQLEDVKIGLKNAEAQYRSAKKNLDNTYIRATTSGNINDDFVQEGAFISPGQKLYEIVDVRKLKLNVKLTASQILNVKEGTRVEMTSPVYPNATFTGKVTAIASKADAALKYNVEIELQNASEKSLKPGMYATAHFNFTGTAESSYLNRNALVGSIQNPQVFIVEKGKARLKKITVGEVFNDKIEVVDGLTPDDKVVVSGQINLAEGTEVKVLNRS